MSGGAHTPDPGAAIRAAAAYFGVVFAAGFMFGTLRTLFIVPRTGEFAAVAVELPAMLLVSWIACGWALGRHQVPEGVRPRLIMAACAFALLMMAELVVSMGLIGRTPGEHLALYRAPPVLLGLLGQFAYAAFPLIRMRAGTVK